MQKIKFSENNINNSLLKFINRKFSSHKIVFLVDENSKKYCLEKIILNSFYGSDFEIIEIESGEQNKSIETGVQLWDLFTDYQFTKETLIIIIGGGVLCDLGAFVSSTYKRGIPYILVPTTLLSMVDASIGGKCGVNFKNYKNQIGIFSNPKAIFIDSIFLKTLNEKDLICGYAEMIKHSLIYDKIYWEKLLKLDIKKITINDIKESSNIKKSIVKLDPFEKKQRKLLNFGHTFAHAIESLYQIEKNEISHGEAVLMGMIFEIKLSEKYNYLLNEKTKQILLFLNKLISIPKWNKNQIKTILKAMKQDKKNLNSQINFTLLNDIGNADVDIYLNEEQILDIF